MTVTIDIQDPNGDTITTLELFDDIYQHMQVEAALNGVTVQQHIIEIVTGYAQRIITDAETT